MSGQSDNEERPLWQYIMILMPLGVALAIVGVILIYFVGPMSQVASSIFSGGDKTELRECIDLPMDHGFDDPGRCLGEVSMVKWWILGWGDRIHRESSGGVGIRTRMKVRAAQSRYRLAERGAVDREKMEEARQKLLELMEEMRGDEEQIAWVLGEWRRLSGQDNLEGLMEGEDEEMSEEAIASFVRGQEPSEWGRLASVPMESDGRQVPVAAALCLAGEMESAEERIAYISEEASYIAASDEAPPLYALALACGLDPEVIGRSSYELEADQEVAQDARMVALTAGEMDRLERLMESLKERRFRVTRESNQALLAHGLLALDRDWEEAVEKLEEMSQLQRNLFRTRSGCPVPTRDRFRAHAWRDPGQMEALGERLGEWARQAEDVDSEEVDEDEEQGGEEWGSRLREFENAVWLEAARQWVWLGHEERAKSALEHRDESGEESRKWCEALVRIEAGDIEGAQALQGEFEGEESRFNWDELGFELLVLAGHYDEAFDRGLDYWKEELSDKDEDDLNRDTATITLWLWAAVESGNYDEARGEVGDKLEAYGFALPPQGVVGDEAALARWRVETRRYHLSRSVDSPASLALVHQWVGDEVDSGVWIDAVLGRPGSRSGVLDYHGLRIAAKDAVGRSDDARERRAMLEALQEAADGPQAWWLMRRL